MRDCKRVRPELSALIDGVLALEARTSVETHLVHCADCRAARRDLENARERLSQLAPGPMAPEEVARILARVAALDEARPVVVAGPGGTRLVVAFLAGVAATLALWLGTSIATGSGARTSIRPSRPPAPLAAEPKIHGRRTAKAAEPDPIDGPAARQRPGPTVLIQTLTVVEPEVMTVADPDGSLRLRVVASTLEALARGLRSSDPARRVPDAPAGPPPHAPSSLASESTAAQGEVALVAWSPGATLGIERDGTSVSLVTRGTVAEVVPALIECLRDDDSDVRALAHDRLDALRDELEASAEWRVRLATPASPEPAPAQGRDAARHSAEADDPQLWSRWWDLNRNVVIAFRSRRSSL